MKTLTKALILLFFLSIGINSQARNYYGTEYTMVQPDSSEIKVFLYGTELYIDAESIDHYTLTKDETTGYICYAMLSSDGNEYASTGIIYTGSLAPEAVKLITEPRIRISKESRNKIIEQKKETLNKNEASQVTLRAATTLPDTVYGVCVLIDFTDTKSSISRDDIEIFLNSDTETISGNAMSIKQYFSWISGGKLTYINYLPADFYTAPNTKEYYSPSEATDYTIKSFYPVITDALNSYTKEKDGFDISDLTVISNRVCAINILYAGTCTNEWATGLWPHQGYCNFDLSAYGFSKNQVQQYQLSDIGSELGMGTFVHENGHLICDWPDFYSYDEHDDNNADTYNIGDAFWIENEKKPNYPNPWAMDQMGWLSHKIDITDINDGRLISLKEGVGYSAVYEGSGNSADEKYYLEVRDHYYGSGKSGKGIFIWHSNESGDNCYEGNDELLDCKPATISNPMWNKTNGPGSFSDTSDPSAIWVSGENSNIYLWDFSAYDTIMTFRCGVLQEDPEFVTTELKDGGCYTYYYDSIISRGGDFPHSFTIEKGTLPDGLTMSSSGVISGIITGETKADLTIKITDASGKEVQQSFTLNTYKSTPYYGTAYNIPGSFNMEYFNLGGEGIAYHDKDSINSGYSLREDNASVYIQSFRTGGYSILQNLDDWAQYSVQVEQNGIYSATIRHSNTVDVYLGLATDSWYPNDTLVLTGVSGSNGTSNSRGYTTSSQDIELSAGSHILSFRVLEDGNESISTYLDSISFQLVKATNITENIAPKTSIYPNPSCDRFTIDNLQGNEEILVYDAQCKLIETIKVTGNRAEFGSSYNAGLYAVLIISDKGIIKEKVIKF